MPSWVLKIKFQRPASLEQSAKKFPNNKCNKMEKIAFSIILLKESIAYVWENYFDKPLWLGIKPSKHASNKRWSLNCFCGGGGVGGAVFLLLMSSFVSLNSVIGWICLLGGKDCKLEKGRRSSSTLGDFKRRDSDKGIEARDAPSTP